MKSGGDIPSAAIATIAAVDDVTAIVTASAVDDVTAIVTVFAIDDVIAISWRLAVTGILTVKEESSDHHEIVSACSGHLPELIGAISPRIWVTSDFILCQARSWRHCPCLYLL